MAEYENHSFEHELEKQFKALDEKIKIPEIPDAQTVFEILQASHEDIYTGHAGVADGRAFGCGLSRSHPHHAQRSDPQPQISYDRVVGAVTALYLYHSYAATVFYPVLRTRHGRAHAGPDAK